MSILTRSQSVGVFALLCGVAAVGSYGLMLRYIRGAAEELDRARGETMALEQRTNTRDAMQAVVRRTEGVRAELAAYLLATQDRTRFLDLVEQELSAEAAVSVKVEKLTEQGTNVAVSSQTKGVPVKETPNGARLSAQRHIEIVLRMAGSWEGVCTYLAYLDALPYVFSIETVSLEMQVDGEEAGTWIGNVRARIAVQ